MAFSTLLAGFWDPIGSTPFYYWQIPVVILLVVIIVFWMRYRKKQM